MEREEALTSLHKQRLEVINLITFFKEVQHLTSYELAKSQIMAQRDTVILKLRKEDDEKKIYRLQGRLDQIEESLSFGDVLEQRKITIEKRINELSKGMKNG